MCTASIVAHARGFRLVCNRDELRTRLRAEPPAWRRTGDVETVWPTDPASGGTWIGANDAGVAMVLLNRTPRKRPARSGASVSRGTIIPRLLRLRSLDTIVKATADLREPFAPFTLVVLCGQEWAAITKLNARRLVVHSRPLAGALMFTSSSLGDHRVQGVRRALFNCLVRAGKRPLEGQAAFHQHSWPDRPEISVCMSRADAATVSRTTIDVVDECISVGYSEVRRCRYAAVSANERSLQASHG